MEQPPISLKQCIIEVSGKVITMNGSDFIYLDTKEKVEDEILIEANELKDSKEVLLNHQAKSKIVEDYVNTLVITTSSGKRIKADFASLSSIEVIINSEYPNNVIPIWKQNINGELVYYFDLPLQELVEAKIEANILIQDKYKEIFITNA